MAKTTREKVIQVKASVVGTRASNRSRPARATGEVLSARAAAVLEPRVVSPGFNERVYSLVRKVPAGHVTTYGQIATLLGSPRVARHVGFAMAACLSAHKPVPWHRVINSRGHISYKGDTARAHEQLQRLREEGVVFDDSGRIDLKRFKWPFRGLRLPPPEAVEGEDGAHNG